LQKGNSQEFTKKFEEKSFQFIQKRQILDGETLTRATRSDAERELPDFFPFWPPHKKLVKEKLPNYILGLAMSRLLKWRELLFFFNQW